MELSHPVNPLAQAVFQGDWPNGWEELEQARAVGLGVAHVAWPGIDVMTFDAVTEDGFDHRDHGEQVGARAEREVHRVRVTDAASHGIGEHARHGFDEREVSALFAVTVDRPTLTWCLIKLVDPS